MLHLLTFEKAARNILLGLALLSGPLSPAWADKLVLVAGGGAEKTDRRPATQFVLQEPFGVDFDPAGNMYIVELSGGRVHRVDPQGMLETIAGTGQKGDAGDGGPGREATFNGMHNLAIDPQGSIYLADTWNNRIRKLDPQTGVVTAFAGTGKKGPTVDGKPALTAEFGGLFFAMLDPAGKRLCVTDLDQKRVHMIDLATGVVSHLAGNGQKGVPTDGAVAKEAPLVDPRAAAVDRQGNLYILERGGHALRVVDPAGKIRTVVGTGKAGATGDGGPGLEATLNGPKHLCIDQDDSVLIADAENHLIRRYVPKEGKLVRVAGTGKKGAKGLGGSPLEAELARPHGVIVHRDGTLYITDSYNHRVLKIVKD